MMGLFTVLIGVIVTPNCTPKICAFPYVYIIPQFKNIKEKGPYVWLSFQTLFITQVLCVRLAYPPSGGHDSL